MISSNTFDGDSDAGAIIAVITLEVDTGIFHL